MSGYNTPTPEDEKATRRALLFLGAWFAIIVLLVIWQFKDDIYRITSSYF